jgi:hypothetical protein
MTKARRVIEYELRPADLLSLSSDTVPAGLRPGRINPPYVAKVAPSHWQKTYVDMNPLISAG